MSLNVHTWKNSLKFFLWFHEKKGKWIYIFQNMIFPYETHSIIRVKTNGHRSVDWVMFFHEIEKWNVVKHVFCHNKHHLKNNYTGNYVMFLVYKSSLGIYLGISPVRIIIYLRSCDLAVKFEYFSFLFSFFKKKPDWWQNKPGIFPKREMVNYSSSESCKSGLNQGFVLLLKQNRWYFESHTPSIEIWREIWIGVCIRRWQTECWHPNLFYTFLAEQSIDIDLSVCWYSWLQLNLN